MAWSTFTAAEDASLLRLRDEQELMFRDIARVLGRTYHSVYSRYRTLKAVQESGAQLHHVPLMERPKKRLRG